ncbi:MAG: NADP-dependent oxidoreductase [Solirubrobacteraceae bacterium]
MRAAAFERFGAPSELRVLDLPEPVVGPDSLLIRVRAAGVNPVDAKIRAGGLEGAFPHAFPVISGWDAAGVVEQAGPAVVGFEPGDEVLTYARKDTIGEGTCAELATVRHHHAAKRGSLGWAEAGGLPLAGLTAYQCLHEGLEVQAGQTIAVRGASGGVGGFAVQLAKAAGARVVGIAGTGSEEHVRALGADEFVSHEDGDAPAADGLVDLAAPDGLAAYAARVAAVASVLSRTPPEGFDGAFRYIFVRPDGAQLAELVALADAGRLRVPVVEEYSLDNVAAAHERMESGGVHGKLVVRV